MYVSLWLQPYWVYGLCNLILINLYSDNSASSSSKKRKKDTATARREKKEKKNEKKRKREIQQQTMMEFAHGRPSKRPNHTSREQEVRLAEEQQSRE